MSLDVTRRSSEVSNFDEIPDGSRLQSCKEKRSQIRSGPRDNKDYYRQYVTYQILQNMFVPVRFWLKNRGAVGARDVYIDLSIKCEDKLIALVTGDLLPSRPPDKQEDSFK